MLSIILVQLGNWVIQTGFEINRDYIAKNLCENRTKPITLCLGSCYLKKEIKTQTEKKGLNPSSRTISLLAVFSSFFNYSPLTLGYIRKIYYSGTPDLTPSHLREFLQPPSLS